MLRWPHWKERAARRWSGARCTLRSIIPVRESSGPRPGRPGRTLPPQAPGSSGSSSCCHPLRPTELQRAACSSVDCGSDFFGVTKFFRECVFWIAVCWALIARLSQDPPPLTTPQHTSSRNGAWMAPRDPASQRGLAERALMPARASLPGASRPTASGLRSCTQRSHSAPLFSFLPCSALLPPPPHAFTSTHTPLGVQFDRDRALRNTHSP